MTNPTTTFSLSEARQKIEKFCAYQERCHQEVHEKLRSFRLNDNEIGELIAHLIDHNFLNEERFARAFARGRHRIKNWGRDRIVNALRRRGFSSYNIKAALEEIPDEDYLSVFDNIADKQWNNIRESNPMKKRTKFFDFLLRQGYESEMICEKLKELENLKI